MMKSMDKLATVVAAASLMGGCGPVAEQVDNGKQTDEEAKRYFVLDEEVRNIPIDLVSNEPKSYSEKAPYTHYRQ